MSVVNDHAEIILDEIRNTATSSWKSLTEAQKTSLERASRRWLELSILEKSGKDVISQKLFVQTTLNDFKLAGEIAVHDAFWKGVAKALDILGTFLAKAGSEFLKATIQGLIANV